MIGRALLCLFSSFKCVLICVSSDACTVLEYIGHSPTLLFRFTYFGFKPVCGITCTNKAYITGTDLDTDISFSGILSSVFYMSARNNVQRNMVATPSTRCKACKRGYQTRSSGVQLLFIPHTFSVSQAIFQPNRDEHGMLYY